MVLQRDPRAQPFHAKRTKLIEASANVHIYLWFKFHSWCSIFLCFIPYLLKIYSYFKLLLKIK